MFHNINLRICEILQSLPSRERGLKYKILTKCFDTVFVAPFAGAWIEIRSQSIFWFWTMVAPFAGAWIEIASMRK